MSANTATPSVAAGSSHSVALKNDGTLVTVGDDSFGQLGLGRLGQSSTPRQVIGLGQVRAVAAGVRASFALKQDGTVWAWGYNDRGQLGDGTTTDRSTPVRVQGLTGVTAIAVGGRHTLALKQDGTVWAWGYNDRGQLGDGTTTDRSTPVRVQGLTGVTAIAVGGRHTLALKQDGTVRAWGGNGSGQLGDGTFGDHSTPVPVPGLTGVAAVAAGFSYTVALRQDGTVWAWGANYSGQLGDGTTANRSTPAAVLGLTEVAAIAGGGAWGGSHTVVLRQDGTVWTWGDNYYGQLGDGTVAQRLTPVLVVNETVNGFLDLIPEVPNNIPPDKIPPFFLATYKTGDLSATTLHADIRGITPIGSFASAPGVSALAAGSYDVYVAAAVPYSGSFLYYQRDSNNVWSALTWPMADFVRGVALGSQDALIRVNILQNVDVSPYIGASILVGYGTDPDEMLTNARYRTIFTVTPPQ